jgi:hypothetical protein
LFGGYQGIYKKEGNTLSQQRNSLRTFAIVFGLFLAGIPFAFLLAGQFINEGAGTPSALIFLLFLVAWTTIGTQLTRTRISAKFIYWSLHIILWIGALVFGSIAASNYQWFPGWLALLFPIGGSLFLATFYKPFMARFSGKTKLQSIYPHEQPYQQGYQPIPQDSTIYTKRDQTHPYSYHEQPQANYPQDMMQQ